MTDTPADIQRKIADLEALRPSLGDAAVNAAIAVLQAQLQPQPDHIRATATIHHDNIGQNAAINAGTMLQFSHVTIERFFGPQRPAEDQATLLATYLASLTSECELLRLHRLVEQAQTGNQQQAVPRLTLQAVYTSLTTSGEHVVLHQRDYAAAHMQRLSRRLRERTSAEVPPEQIRAIDIDFCTPPDERFFAHIDMLRSKTLTLDDIPGDTPLRLRITRPELATEAIRRNHRLVLLGEPGSGKSTVLRYLALLLALRIQGQSVALPAGWDSTFLPVPILCPLGAIAELLHATGDANQALWQAIERALDDTQGSRAGLRAHLNDAIRRGGVLLLFDGLDELPTSGTNPRQQVARAICAFAIQTAPQTPIVVSSRVKAYQESTAWQLPAEEGWQVRQIQPLAFGQVRQFVQQWYAELAHTLDEPADQRAQRLIEALHSTPNQRIQRLIESPLLLTMLAILHYNRNELPDDRVEVYEQCVDLLLDRWEPQRTPGVQHSGLLARLAIPDLRIEQLREELHKLALDAHARPPGDDGRGFLDRYALTGRLVEFFARLRAPEPLDKVNLFIDGLIKDAGLLQSPADDRYAFPHLTFQEYLAACGLASRTDMVDTAYHFWTSSDASRWREVLLLFMGRLRQQGSLAVERDAVAWLERLMAAKLGRQSKSARQRAQDAALAALSYHELGGQTALAGTQIDVEARIEHPLRSAIVDLLATPDSGVVLADRLAAARVLADLGDPRFPVTLAQWRDDLIQRNDDFGTPHGYWCAIRPGSYRIGGWQDNNASADITLPAVWIARYPLTVAQYRAFIAAGGYDCQEYWTPNGWQWRQERKRTQPYLWDDIRFSSPNQAVIGVSWYEAMACCAWLTTMLADVLPAGYVMCLPSEAEWEAAAAYDASMQRQTYPWGEDEPTPEHAIFADKPDNRLGAPAPVGVCPAGAAACGALDMAGNVWEWCSSSHAAYPAQSDAAAKDFTPFEGVVPVRCGSWYENATNVRFWARGWGDPIFYDFGRGFRLLLAPRVER